MISAVLSVIEAVTSNAVPIISIHYQYRPISHFHPVLVLVKFSLNADITSKWYTFWGTFEFKSIHLTSSKWNDTLVWSLVAYNKYAECYCNFPSQQYWIGIRQYWELKYPVLVILATCNISTTLVTSITTAATTVALRQLPPLLNSCHHHHLTYYKRQW